MVIASNDDRSCKDCVELLNDIDMMEMDLKLVKNSLSLSIKKKYGFLDDADNEIQVFILLKLIHLYCYEIGTLFYFYL